MQTFAIIPGLNVLEDGGTGLGTRSELSKGTVELEAAEKAFHDSIVVAVTDAAHADATLQERQAVLVGHTGVIDYPGRNGAAGRGQGSGE